MSQTFGAVNTKCPMCGDTHICRECGGRGGAGQRVPPVPGDPEPPGSSNWTECPACHGTGSCHECSATS